KPRGAGDDICSVGAMRGPVFSILKSRFSMLRFQFSNSKVQISDSKSHVSNLKFVHSTSQSQPQFTFCEQVGWSPGGPFCSEACRGCRCQVSSISCRRS